MEWQLTYKPDRYFKDICCDKDSSKDLNKLFHIFEYFPSEEALEPSRTNLFTDSFQDCVAEIKKEGRFLNGILLKDILGGGKFPFLNFVTFVEDEDDFMRPSDKWLSLSSKCEKILNGEKDHSLMAGYEDYETLAFCAEASKPKVNSVFLISSFKVSGNLEWLEKNWRQWSGVTCILKNLSDSLRRDLQRISFFRRVVPHGDFIYILLCEVTCPKAEHYRFKDLVERMNERYSGYSQAYIVLSVY